MWAGPDQGVISMGGSVGLQEGWEWKRWGPQELPIHDKFTTPPLYKGLEEDPLLPSLRGSHSDAEFAFTPSQNTLEQSDW